MEMLTYKREDLVGVLKAKLAEREAEREAAREKADAKVIDMSTALTAAMDEHQQLVVFLASVVQEEFGLDPSDKNFADDMAKHYDYEDGAAIESDASLRKQIRVLEGAADETVEVHVQDEIYAYL